MKKEELKKLIKNFAKDAIAPYKSDTTRKTNLDNQARIEVKEKPFSISKYIRGHLYGDWTDADREKYEYVKVNKVLTEGGTGAAGAFLVPPEFSTEIIENLRAKAVVRQTGARIYPINTDTIRFPRVGSSTVGSWMEGEDTNKSGTDMSFEQVELVLKEYAGLCMFLMH